MENNGGPVHDLSLSASGAMANNKITFTGQVAWSQCFEFYFSNQTKVK